MALLDLKEKKQWADFASKECISVDAAGCIDAKETQVPARKSPPRVFVIADVFTQQARVAKQAAIDASDN